MGQVEIVVSSLNVRSSPIDGDRLSVVRDGDILNVLMIDLSVGEDGWYKVDLGEEEGWLSGNHVTFTEIIDWNQARPTRISEPLPGVPDTQSSNANESLGGEQFEEIQDGQCLPEIISVIPRMPTSSDDPGLLFYLDFSVSCTDEVKVYNNLTAYPSSNTFQIWGESLEGNDFWTFQARKGNKCDIKAYTIVSDGSGSYKSERHLGSQDPEDEPYECKFTD